MCRKVFLGGTCNGSKWRDQLIPKLKLNFFNPVVEEWSDVAKQQEIKERAICDALLYVITPKMTGFYSIAELVHDAVGINFKIVIFCFLKEDDGLEFTSHQIASLQATAKMVEDNNGYVFETLDEVANFLNSNYRETHYEKLLRTIK